MFSSEFSIQIQNFLPNSNDTKFDDTYANDTYAKMKCIWSHDIWIIIVFQCILIWRMNRIVWRNEIKNKGGVWTGPVTQHRDHWSGKNRETLYLSIYLSLYSPRNGEQFWTFCTQKLRQAWPWQREWGQPFWPSDKRMSTTTLMYNQKQL